MQDHSQSRNEERNGDIEPAQDTSQKNGEYYDLSGDFTDDTILNGRISIRQPKKGYRVAMDPIVLASKVNVQEKQSVLDVGGGVGTISLILKFRVPSASVTSIDIDPKMCDLCRYNALKNGLHLDIHNASIEDFCTSSYEQKKREKFETQNQDQKLYQDQNQLDSKPKSYLLKQNQQKQYDHVVTNPPFFKKESSRISETKIMANFETIELSLWIHLCLNLLKPHGTFSIIHEPSRISEILAALQGRAGSVSIFPVYSNEHSDKAVRIIVQSIKENRGSTKIMKGIFQG